MMFHYYMTILVHIFSLLLFVSKKGLCAQKQNGLPQILFAGPIFDDHISQIAHSHIFKLPFCNPFFFFLKEIKLTLKKKYWRKQRTSMPSFIQFLLTFAYNNTPIAQQ